MVDLKTDAKTYTELWKIAHGKGMYGKIKKQDLMNLLLDHQKMIKELESNGDFYT